MKINIPEKADILVFTGPESSGKTTCAERITRESELPLVEEYAREYLNLHGVKYTLDDIRKMAVEQVKRETEAHRNHQLIVCDTDIVTLEIWALEKFETSLDFTDELIDKKHYLLCYPDLPWEPDPLRENPDDRMRLFERYKQFLEDLNASFTILKAKGRNELFV